MWPWAVSAFRSYWPECSGLLWPGAVPIYPVEKKTWHIPRFLLAFQSLSFGLVWCRIILSDEISQLNHHISATSPISCRRLWLSDTLRLQLEQHSPSWAWISPLWTTLAVLSLTYSCHTFTNPELPLPHSSCLRLFRLIPTMFTWEAHPVAGSGIHKAPAQGKAVERGSESHRALCCHESSWAVSWWPATAASVCLYTINPSQDQYSVPMCPLI